MEIKLIIPPNFYIANENASPPLQFEPFYNYADIDFIHLKRSDALDAIPESELYGISAYTTDIKMADIIARFLKDRDKNCKVAIGGHHATYRSNELSGIYDYVIVGNGEGFINRVVNDNLPSERLYIGEGRNAKFDQRSFRHFAPYNPNFHRGYTASYTLRTSFGCYWNCAFCNNRGVFLREVDEIESQLSFLSEQGVSNLRIIDEVFTEHPHFEAICRLFSSFEWIAQTRLDKLSTEKARIMSDNGCAIVQVGVESFNSAVRQKLNKQLTSRNLWKGIEIAEDCGLKLHIFIMVGTPYDTYDTLKRTVAKGRNLKDGVEIRPQIFCPFPGSAMGDNPGQYNMRMLTNEYEYFTTLPFQNQHGRLVAVPKHIHDADKWEAALRDFLYELNTPRIRHALDNPLTAWHTNSKYSGSAI